MIQNGELIEAHSCEPCRDRRPRPGRARAGNCRVRRRGSRSRPPAPLGCPHAFPSQPSIRLSARLCLLFLTQSNIILLFDVHYRWVYYEQDFPVYRQGIRRARILIISEATVLTKGSRRMNAKSWMRSLGLMASLGAVSVAAPAWADGRMPGGFGGSHYFSAPGDGFGARGFGGGMRTFSAQGQHGRVFTSPGPRTYNGRQFGAGQFPGRVETAGEANPSSRAGYSRIPATVHSHPAVRHLNYAATDLAASSAIGGIRTHQGTYSSTRTSRATDMHTLPITKMDTRIRRTTDIRASMAMGMSTRSTACLQSLPGSCLRFRREPWSYPETCT
jgi:hypothetical protein